MLSPLRSSQGPGLHAAPAEELDVSHLYVPKGFPRNLSGPLIWEGKDFVSDPDQYVYHLGDDEIAEIDSAIAYFKGNLNKPQTVLNT
jgi:hypothetical protein